MPGVHLLKWTLALVARVLLCPITACDRLYWIILLEDTTADPSPAQRVTEDLPSNAGQKSHSVWNKWQNLLLRAHFFSLSLSHSLSLSVSPLSEATGKPLLSTKYDQTHGIIGFINMPKYNLVKCISGRDNHLQLLRGIWNKYVCMQIRNTFFMYCAHAVHESTLDLWQCVCIIAGLGWVDLCWDL